MNVAVQDVPARNRRGRFRRWWRINGIGSVDHDAVLRQVAEEAGWSPR